MERIALLSGDITRVPAGAVVNAANASLLGGGGVDGAIHRAGGPEILAACRAIVNRQGRCEAGEAVITRAGKLPAEWVIHTVGPVWNGGDSDEVRLLRNAYLNCFRLVKEYAIKTVSFPNISTGVYRFPKTLAAEIALDTIAECLRENNHIEQVNLVCFDQSNYDIYQQQLAKR